MQDLIGKVNCLDCLELLKRIPEGSIDLVVTDPPYLMQYKTNWRKDRAHRFCRVIDNDNNEELLSAIIPELFRVMKDNTALYMFCNSNKIEVFKRLIEKQFKIKNIIVWVKNNWTAGDLSAQYGKQYEFIIYAIKGRRRINGKRIADVWPFNRVSGKRQVHQNEKPVELISRIIENSSDPGQLVFDPFMGSWTTAVSCVNTGRQWIGCDTDRDFCSIGEKRISEALNQQQTGGTMTANDPCNGGIMPETLFGKAFEGVSVFRKIDAANLEAELINDTGLTLSQLHDSIDRAMGIDRKQRNSRILTHPAVKRGLYNDQKNQEGK